MYLRGGRKLVNLEKPYMDTEKVKTLDLVNAYCTTMLHIHPSVKCICRLNYISVKPYLRLSSPHTGFLPRSKDMRIRLTGSPKLPIGLNVNGPERGER